MALMALSLELTDTLLSVGSFKTAFLCTFHLFLFFSSDNSMRRSACSALHGVNSD